MHAANDSAMTVPTPGGEIDAFQHLSPQEVERAQALARELDARDSFAVMRLGVGSQKELSALTDQVLKMTRTKNTGPAGAALSELLQEIRALDVGSFAEQAESWLTRLPLIGGMFSEVRRFISSYETISYKIDRTVVALENARNKLIHDLVMLENLYTQNQAQFRELLIAIAAGELVLRTLGAERDELAERAEEEGDPVLAQQVADLGEALAGLERRVHDLKLAAMVCLQSGPQIRLVQGSDRALVEKIQSSILTTIPIWKQHVIIAIALFSQKKAQELVDQVDRTTNRMLIVNAAMIKQAVKEVSERKERGFVEIETLRSVNQQLIETIDETIRIQEEGRCKRREVEAELSQLQAALKNKLMEVPPARAR